MQYYSNISLIQSKIVIEHLYYSWCYFMLENIAVETIEIKLSKGKNQIV